MSSILPVRLQDSPASGRGRFSTIGVLEPVIWIERSADAGDGDGSTDDQEPVYRIVVAFVLEVSIVGFDQRCLSLSRSLALSLSTSP